MALLLTFLVVDLLAFMGRIKMYVISADCSKCHTESTRSLGCSIRLMVLALLTPADNGPSPATLTSLFLSHLGKHFLPQEHYLFSLAVSSRSSNYTVLPTDYIIGPASGTPNMCLSWPKALPPSSDGIDWQIGSAFLQTVYSIFR